MIVFAFHLPTAGVFNSGGLPPGLVPPRSIGDSLRLALEEKGWTLEGRTPWAVRNNKGQPVANIRQLASGPAWAWVLEAPREQLDAIEVWVGMRACQLRGTRTGKDLYNPLCKFLSGAGAAPAGPRGVYTCSPQQWAEILPILEGMGGCFWAWEGQQIKGGVK